MPCSLDPNSMYDPSLLEKFRKSRASFWSASNSIPLMLTPLSPTGISAPLFENSDHRGTSSAFAPSGSSHFSSFSGTCDIKSEPTLDGWLLTDDTPVHLPTSELYDFLAMFRCF